MVTSDHDRRDQNSVDLTFKADDRAKIAVGHLSIKGIAKIGDRESVHTAALPVPRGQSALEDVLLAVALPTPFVIKGEYDMGFAARGSVHKRKYKIIRNGYDGPIEVSLADRQARHLQGVTGPTIVVPAGAAEFTYAATLPPWMETGTHLPRLRHGRRRHQGARRRRASRLVQLGKPERAACRRGRPRQVGAGTAADIVCRQARPIDAGAGAQSSERLGVEGPVTLELVTPGHIHGLTAAPATIAAGQEHGRWRSAVRLRDRRAEHATDSARHANAPRYAADRRGEGGRAAVGLCRPG